MWPYSPIGEGPLLSGEAEGLFTLSEEEKNSLREKGYCPRRPKRVTHGQFEGCAVEPWVRRGHHSSEHPRVLRVLLGSILDWKAYSFLFLPNGGYPAPLHEKWSLQRQRAARVLRDPSTAVYRLAKRRDSGCRVAERILRMEARNKCGAFFGRDWDGNIAYLFSSATVDGWDLGNEFPEESPLSPQEAQAFWEWWVEDILPLWRWRRQWGPPLLEGELGSHSTIWAKELEEQV